MAGLPILRSEVTHAIKLTKSYKAPGPDGVLAEAIKCFEEDNIDLLVELFNNIYNTGSIPKDWLLSTIIMIPKKPNATSCKDHRLISLMSHLLKIFLRIIHTRIFKRLEELSGDTQFGFKNGMGTREAVFCLNTLMQNCLDQRKEVFMCFIDYEKAFDTVKHDILIRHLHTANIYYNDVRIIKNLYWNQEARVQISQQDITEKFEVLRGVRQGCILSPMLFNLYVENIFLEALENVEAGIKINGIILNNLRYADDTVIMASSAEELQLILDRINDVGKRNGLIINIKKTKFMIVSRIN